MQGQQRDFSKAFNTVSHNILICKVREHNLNEWTTRQLNNWLDDQAQTVSS